ncbi:tuberin isoform X2 [Macrosteles quadrilineatus]|uniref:tuberin isoform X2 n=1 Tax=Macrosteles quadrilineatus TaxID=74068 RepID=UPI0023E25540|nr:tuberin isoform X2 [Macrosteles quadrilineatus]
MSKANIKDTKTLDKLKQFFRSNKSGGAGFKLPEDYSLTNDLEKELSPETSVGHRVKAIRELSDIVLNHRLEEEAVKKLWHCVKDLLNDPVAREHRHLAFHFLRCLVQGQAERLGIQRVHYFKLVKTHSNPEDVGQRLDLLMSLVEGGRNIEYLEEEIGPFLLEWFGQVVTADREVDFLHMLVNLIKYNAAYIDEDVLHGFVHNICMLAMKCGDTQTVLGCLQVLDTVVCYSTLPRQSLPIYISCLCRTVNTEAHCMQSWKIMRNLLGTHMGHSGIYTMVRLLQATDLQSDAQLLRGAVFHITMALWSAKRVDKLKCTHTSILPSFQFAIQSDHPTVVYEVMQTVHRLVTKYGLQLADPTWTILLALMEAIIQHIENHPSEPVTLLTTTFLHEALCTVEQLIELGQFNGSVRTVFQLIERCSSVRPESSVMRLITYLSRSIVPTQHDWLGKLNSLLELYLHQETRTNIRLRALDVLSSVTQANRFHFEDELLEVVVLPHLEHVDQEKDVTVRNAIAALVTDLCLHSAADNKHYLELLDILEKVMMRAFEAEEKPLTEAEAVDVKTAVDGVIKIFTSAMFTVPSAHAVRAYRMLVSYIELHYNKPVLFDNVTSIRLMILECFLRLRVDSSYRLGYPGSAGPRYSQYLLVGAPRTPPASPGPFDITYLSLTQACNALITCLRQELDWKVLLSILQGVMQVVKNKALILSKHDNNIDHLAHTLCAMVSDKSLCLPEVLRNTPPKFTRSDFQGYVFPVLAALASYHAQLEPSLQQRLIKCLEFGLVSRSARQCVMALTSCILEMRDAMVKLLPEVLLNLSKISATVYIAIPILEFLSTLTRLPKVYANFVVDQYMSVFAIALPYTSPFKYNHYTVSLAHHVIAVWFLKCRLPFRRDFVKFIITGLRANVLVPFEEGQKKPAFVELVNEDSSNRKRSSSLTEQGSRRPQGTSGRLDLKPRIDEALMNFHKELTETCIDLMARYTFSTCSALPKRTAIAQFLLNEGHSATWLLGSKLITVTTSGCSQKPLKNGLCDKCYHTCRLEKDSLLSPSLESADPEKTRGLHKTLSRSGSTEMSGVGLGEEMRKSETSLHDSDPGRLDQMIYGAEKQERSLCACWCQGWAEIYVRRPTGDMSWTMRLQNEPHSVEVSSMSDITTLFLPSLTARKTELDLDLVPAAAVSDRPISEPVSIPGSPVRHSSQDSVDTLGDDDLEGSGRSRNPVRRSNSSPEMSASWKNPFMTPGNQGGEEGSWETSAGNTNETKKKQTTKDLRVNCEAIPEEMGTTPPKTDVALPATTTPTTLTTPATDQRKMSAPAAVPQEWTLPTVDSQQTPAVKPTQPEPSSVAPTVKKEPQPVREEERERGVKQPLTLPPTSHLAAKPPLSPPATQMSPRLQPKQVKPQVEGEMRPDPSALPPLAFKRDRGHTISVMSPIRKDINIIKNRSPRTKEPPRSGVSPSFVFLQLYHSAHFGSVSERPLALSNCQMVQRAFKNLDRIPPYETHKVGVIYVGPGQANSEAEILRNQCGSLRYTEFLQRLGTLIRLADVDPQTVFLGGLERNGNDGKFAYNWQDDVTQVIFHVATLMPTRDNDPNCNAKKLHIGNDHVTIVYNESGEPYNRNTVKCQFNYTCVVVEPLDHGINLLSVKAKDELVQHIGHSEPKIVSDQNVALMARQLALHANLASRVACSLKTEGCDPYTSNWLERLRQIKRIRSKILQEENPVDRHAAARRFNMEDFTEYS